MSPKLVVLRERHPLLIEEFLSRKPTCTVKRTDSTTPVEGSLSVALDMWEQYDDAEMVRHEADHWTLKVTPYLTYELRGTIPPPNPLRSRKKKQECPGTKSTSQPLSPSKERTPTTPAPDSSTSPESTSPPSTTPNGRSSQSPLSDAAIENEDHAAAGFLEAFAEEACPDDHDVWKVRPNRAERRAKKRKVAHHNTFAKSVHPRTGGINRESPIRDVI